MEPEEDEPELPAGGDSIPSRLTETVREAEQAKAELLAAVTSSASISAAARPEIYNWILSLDPARDGVCESVDSWVRQWEGSFPPYDPVVTLLRRFSGVASRVSSYRCLAQISGS